jgi:hypothetical protein
MHSPTAHDPRGRSAPGAAVNLSAAHDRRELDALSGDGLHVQLLWDPITDGVAVTVADARTGLELEVPVGDGERPLDVFQRPFAYAAHRGIDPRPASRVR